MATRTHVGQWLQKGVYQVVWSGLTGSDDGDGVDLSRFPDRTVHVSGTFDSATCTIQGSNTGVNYVALNDSRGEGNSLAFTAEDVKVALENPKMVRPLNSGGGGSTSLTVTIIAKG